MDFIDDLYNEWAEIAEPAWETLINLAKLFKETHGITEETWDRICEYADKEVKDPIIIP